MENLGYVCPLIFYLFIYFQTEEHRGWGGRFSLFYYKLFCPSMEFNCEVGHGFCPLFAYFFFSFFSLIHDNLWLIICRLDWLRGQCHASGGWINGMWWVEAQNGNEHKSLKYDAPPPSTSFHLDGHGPQPTLPLIWIAAFTPLHFSISGSPQHLSSPPCFPPLHFPQIHPIHLSNNTVIPHKDFFCFLMGIFLS